MRIARISIDRALLETSGGMDIKLFKDMLDYLPKFSKIVGFGSVPYTTFDYILIQNSLFIDTPQGHIPPDIKVNLSKDFGGNVYCTSVNCDIAIGLSSSNSGYLSGGALHICDYQPATLFNLVEERCTKCGAKKP
jgi:hypothetical protein